MRMCIGDDLEIKLIVGGGFEEKKILLALRIEIILHDKNTALVSCNLENGFHFSVVLGYVPSDQDGIDLNLQS